VSSGNGKQYLFLDRRRVRQICFTGLVGVKNVSAGSEPVDRCRMRVLFFDRHDAQFGEIRDVGLWEGTQPWSRIVRTLAVPRETCRLQVSMGFHNTSGVCSFDNLRLEVTPGDASFRPPSSVRIDTRGWWPFRPHRAVRGPPALDVRFLLDLPAGRHGFLTRRPDGHL